MQEKLHQGKRKQLKKVQKIVPVLDGNLSVRSALRLSAKYLENKICKIKQIQNILVTPKTFLNQLKKLNS